MIARCLGLRSACCHVLNWRYVKVWGCSRLTATHAAVFGRCTMVCCVTVFQVASRNSPHHLQNRPRVHTDLVPYDLISDIHLMNKDELGMRCGTLCKVPMQKLLLWQALHVTFAGKERAKHIARKAFSSQRWEKGCDGKGV